MRVLVIDNYDSFTFNLVQLFAELTGRESVQVARHDGISLDEIAVGPWSHLVISPGPRGPAEAGISVELVRRFQGRIPILGVCLGHQCMVAAAGGRVIHAERVMHGKTSVIRHDGRGIFNRVPSPFTAARYHSLIADAAHLPPQFEATAWSERGEVMAIRDRTGLLEGVQFHPESFMTEHGPRMAQNFLTLAPSACLAPSS